MSKIKMIFNKIILSLALALITLFSSIATIGFTKQTANALPADYTGDPYTIYYFFDYYPSISPSALKAAYNYNDDDTSSNTYNIIYDRQRIGYQTFTNMVYNDYFDGFGEDCIVIIDIKNFKPDETTLYDLFYDLKVNQGCTTMFISIYDGSYYSNTAFEDYVDVFYTATFVRLENMINNILTNEYEERETLDDTTILIDENLIDVNYWLGSNMDILCGASPFLRILLNQLAEYYDLTGQTYTQIAHELYQNHNIRLLVPLIQYGAVYAFIDLTTWETYDKCSNIDALCYYNGDPMWENIFAVGFTNLSDAFYAFLYAGQEKDDGTLDFNKLPVYLLEAEPYTSSLLGLKASVFNGGDDELDELLALLQAC
jgi:hypothetical protein